MHAAGYEIFTPLLIVSLEFGFQKLSDKFLIVSQAKYMFKVFILFL
jgi:hypothetical protein